MNIGVLALQGGFAEHIAALEQLGVHGFQIRNPSDLGNGIDALVLPGGESTVIGRLLRETRLFSPIKNLVEHGLPVFGTCAGLILLASVIENDPTVHIGALPITVRRNAYGRQAGSFHVIGNFAGIGEIPMTFIRAPVIAITDPSVKILATIDGQIVAAEHGNILVTAFHPELTGDLRVHAYFLEQIVRYTGFYLSHPR